MIALDTHAWIWFHVSRPRLNEEILSQVDRDTVLSAISLWEVFMLIEKGRLKSPFTPEDTIKKWLDAAPVRVVAIDAQISLLSRSLKFKHDDPADRFIGATAYREGVPLVTADANLQSLDWLRTVAC